MRVARWMSVVMVAAMAPGLARAVDVDDRHTVRPGDGIGVIRLGMTVPEVHAAMQAWGAKSLLTGSKGGPGAWLDEASGAAIEAYQTDSLGKGRFGNTMKVFYVKNRVGQVSVMSVAYATPKGATTRMSSTEFRAIHSSLRAMPVRTSWNGTIRVYDSLSLGLAVTYPVLVGGETRAAQEIFVHKPGVPVIIETPRARPERASAAGAAPGRP